MVPPKFALGRCVITPAAHDSLHPGDVSSALDRHVHCDWGEPDLREDWRAQFKELCRNVLASLCRKANQEDTEVTLLILFTRRTERKCEVARAIIAAVCSTFALKNI